MRCILFNTTKTVNSTYVPTGTGLLDTDIAFKAPCNVLAPTIVFNRQDAVLNHNYIKVQFDGLTTGAGNTHDWRYYFLASQTITSDNLVECTYFEDVLGTQWSKISGTTQRIARCTDGYYQRTEVTDPMVVATNNWITSTLDIADYDDRFNMTSGYFLLGLTKKNSSGGYPLIQQGSVSYYLIPSNQFSQFVEDLSNLTGFIADINPLQFIVSCKYIPYTTSELRTTFTRLGTAPSNAIFEFPLPPKSTLFEYQFKALNNSSTVIYTTGLHPDYRNVFEKNEIFKGDSINKGNQLELFKRINSWIETKEFVNCENMGAVTFVCEKKDVSDDPKVELKLYHYPASSSSYVNPTFIKNYSWSDTLPYHSGAGSATRHFLNQSPYMIYTYHAGPFGDIYLEYKYGMQFREKILIDLVAGCGTLQILDSRNDIDVVYYQKSVDLLPNVNLAQITSNSYITQSTIDNQRFLSNVSAASQIASGVIGLATGGLTLAPRISTTISGIKASHAWTQTMKSWDFSKEDIRKYKINPFEKISDNDYASLVYGGGQAASGIAGAIGGVFGIIAASRAYTTDTIANSMPKVSYTVPNGCFSSLFLPWFITIEELSVQFPDYTEWGRPSGIYAELSEVGDVFICSEVKLEGLSMLPEEKEILANILMSKVYN